MRGELIALDLETTGLDVEQDSIIEIGAVRLRDGKIDEEFGVLINPGFVIPAETTHITGIHQDDLRNAPLLTDVLPQISNFVGQAPIIAHNVSFDIGFMRRFGTLKQNLPIDTLELATVLLPTVPRYSLSSLTEHFGIELENAHRALDDARATAILYWHFWEKALSLPPEMLFEITQSMQTIPWETGEVFRAAYEIVKANNADTISNMVGVFEPLTQETKALSANDLLVQIDAIESAKILDEDGTLANSIDRYEQRPQQVEMAQAIADSFNNSQHLLIEAGTGIGKSLAYLVPAIQWAVKNNQRVVVSTNTINLQEQLINHDVPLIKQAMELEFDAQVMKGRGNYLCPRRLAAIRRRRPSNIDELKTLAKILIWLQESQTGDRGEISLRGGEYFVWSRLSAEDEDCSLHRCQMQMNGSCPYYKARKRADAAHIVIANHALLISDAASENSVLPPYHYLVVDEAHQLEDAITYGMSFRVDQIGLLRRLSDLGGVNSGLLGDLLKSIRADAPDKYVMRLEVFIQDIGNASKAMQSHVRSFFGTVEQFIQDSHSENNPKIRLDEKKRGLNAFNNVCNSWESLDEFFEVVVDAMGQLPSAINKLKKYNVQGIEDHINAAAAAARNLKEIHTELRSLIDNTDANRVYWVNNARTVDYISLQSAPLHVGPLMEDYLWNTKESIVLTSATLRTSDDFTFLRDRLYANTAHELALGSPFNYRESTLVYIPDDIPMPHEQGYQRAVERGIVDLAAALDGRVLVLFTSYAQLRETAANISPRLAMGNITVYDQATGGSQETLLDNFKSTEKAVLLGTRSFWEGVDIPGDDLVALVIVRLPFAVPNDPIFAARSGSYPNSFNDYAIPDAILRFRQGFGRLIRTKTDRGIVTIFDSRIINKSYGLKFVESLPDVSLKYGQLSELPNASEKWLEGKD
jgi:DNA polymerase-3 subunit epsilon/ATP-dependent DNA helicase DinG